MIKKILIANRGEIAVRIISTCKEMNIRTVAIYANDDADRPHRYEADEAYCLGEGPLSETYLNKQKIIDIAKSTGCDAIHPGYGFLSEKSDFAALVETSGLIFIGPTSESIILMGDKKGSKVRMESIGIPLVPGYHGDNQDAVFLKEQSKKIGFPQLIKASAGGGGKGMRIVENIEEFAEKLEQAKREALKSFGDDRVLIERYIVHPRHIEVQLMGDGKGKCLHFFERECSIQRRYQKIIEETPSPALTPDIRQKICQTAVKIGESINYRGAGTIEFIYDKDGSFYFLEMNTRIQVEHPITEMVTGHDLVKWQIKVAQGDRLDLEQKDIHQIGHAIECRICAEDPDNDFLPTSGTVNYIGKTLLRNTRLDLGIYEGNTIGVNYDSMVAKTIVHGRNRVEAINKMIKLLDDYLFLGLKTNRDYLKRILGHDEFVAGKNIFTHFVHTYADGLAPIAPTDEEKALAIASYYLADAAGWVGPGKVVESTTSSVWSEIGGVRI